MTKRGRKAAKTEKKPTYYTDPLDRRFVLIALKRGEDVEVFDEDAYEKFRGEGRYGVILDYSETIDGSTRAVNYVCISTYGLFLERHIFVNGEEKELQIYKEA
jgi:hypothetical protein